MKMPESHVPKARVARFVGLASCVLYPTSRQDSSRFRPDEA